MKAKSRLWIQKAVRRPGAFTAQAKRAKMSVQGFAREVIAHPSKYTLRTRRRALLAQRFAKMGRARRRATMIAKHLSR